MALTPVSVKGCLTIIGEYGVSLISVESRARAVSLTSAKFVCFRIVFLLSAEIKKAHGFVLIHALGGLYSVVREFGSLQKGKNTFFTSAKSLVKILTVETAKPPILSGVSWAISFSLPFDGGADGARTRHLLHAMETLSQMSYSPFILALLL